MFQDGTMPDESAVAPRTGDHGRYLQTGAGYLPLTVKRPVTRFM